MLLSYQKKWKCPKHGEVDEAIHVTIEGHGIEGSYCMVCALEKLVKIIPKLEEINANSE
jgi:hypothetical protein